MAQLLVAQENNRPPAAASPPGHHTGQPSPLGATVPWGGHATAADSPGGGGLVKHEHCPVKHECGAVAPHYLQSPDTKGVADPGPEADRVNDKGDEVTAMEQMLEAPRKRPAAMGRPAAAGPKAAAIKGKPAACPAAVASAGATGRPKRPADTHKGTAIPYKHGKVLVSGKMQGYRVFPVATDTKERRVGWKQHPTRDAAWSAALDHIE